MCIRDRATYAKKIEKHYGCYMDMEWALDHKNRLWILQARPETVWSKKNKDKKTEANVTTVSYTHLHIHSSL